MSMPWPQRPVIYEINTWVWLNDLSWMGGESVTLATVPASQWDAIAALGVDAVWLMGVWQRSPAGIRVANANPDLQADFRRSLPDYTLADNVGSAYCVRDYVVDDHLGGPMGLAAARAALASRGILLILDFVPNHVAPDHPWTLEHPEYFILGTDQDMIDSPTAFVKAGNTVIACGRDPYFPPWQDVTQLNAFSPDLRQAAIATLHSIFAQCDGVRCDMAMLMLNSVFERTWGTRAGSPPAAEYWTEIINVVRARHADKLFIAEAYWELEWQLQQLGFDYCYDKRLYDRLERGPAETVRLHLTAGLDYQDKLLRFIENHDEPRSAAAFSFEHEQAAAVTIMTLPGAKLLYEGQIEGRKVRPPVFLGRRPPEPPGRPMLAFYEHLLPAAHNSGLSGARWQMCEHGGWPDNQSYRNLVAWCWQNGDRRRMVVVNLSGYR
jgi:glycosidase